jgi:steroid 5-alpha reductase family enzyme
MSFAAAVAIVKKDNTIADIAYGWGFVVVTGFTFLVGPLGFTGVLASLLVIIWAARLSIRIYLRHQGKPEDFRYKEMREKWGTHAARNTFFQVFMLQAVIIFLVSVPVTLLNIYGNGLGFSFLALLGLLIWIKGFCFEAIGDWQLSTFMKNPENKGKIMNRGLWKYTRHPNYYGESLMWWGLGLISFSVLITAQGFFFALLAFIGPIIITFLLLKVSGVPLLEKSMAGKPGWDEYKAKTNVFIPWFPKKDAK